VTAAVSAATRGTEPTAAPQDDAPRFSRAGSPATAERAGT